jgi:hypothetical protein
MRSPVTSKSAGPAPATRAASTAPAGCTLLAALFSLAAGCAGSTPSEPAPPGRPAAPTNPSLPPAVSGPPAPGLYQRVSPSRYGPDAYLLAPGAENAFVMIFDGGRTYPGWSGRYTRADSVLDFRYDAWSAAGELAARGILRGDTLLLRYNAVMQWTDFEDGVYVRSPVTP